MSHQPFEDLLFSDQELSRQESSALQDHLQHCDQCARLSIAWQEVEPWLEDAPVLEPETGFVTRWQARLETELIQQERRQNRVMLAGTLGAAVVLFAAITYLVWPLIQSPKVILFTYLYQVLSLFSLTNLVRGLSAGLSTGLAGGIPWLPLVFVAGILTELAVLWVVSLRVLTKPRRVTL